MELGLQFDDEDLNVENLSLDSNSGPQESRYVPKQCTSEWYVEKEAGKLERDVAEVKFEADLAFVAGDFKRSHGLYLDVLARSKGMCYIRDVLEGLARCCIQSGLLDEALRWAVKLQMTSHPTNPDHNTVSYNLLSEVFHARNEPNQEAACLSAVILNHPLLPHLWAKMGRVYLAMSKNEMSFQQTTASIEQGASNLATREAKLVTQNQIFDVPNAKDMSSTGVSSEDKMSIVQSSLKESLSAVHLLSKDSLRLQHLSAACLVRSLLLLKSVQKSVSDFVRVANLNSQRKIEVELEQMNLEPIVSRKILVLVSKNLKIEDSALGDVSEFEDLGKSVRMKALEEGFKKLDSNLEFNPSSISLPSISSFEIKMLSYLDLSE